MLRTNGHYFSEQIVNRSVQTATFSIRATNLYDCPVEDEEVPHEENLDQAKEAKSRRPGRDTR